MIHDVKYLVICLFAICIFSLMRLLLRSLAHILVWLFEFLLWSFKSSLNIFDSNSSSDVFFANISPSLWLVFHSLDIVFHGEDTVNFNEDQLINFFFHGFVSLVFYLKCHHCIQGHLGFLLCHLLISISIHSAIQT